MALIRFFAVFALLVIAACAPGGGGGEPGQVMYIEVNNRTDTPVDVVAVEQGRASTFLGNVPANGTGRFLAPNTGARVYAVNPNGETINSYALVQISRVWGAPGGETQPTPN